MEEGREGEAQRERTGRGEGGKSTRIEQERMEERERKRERKRRERVACEWRMSLKRPLERALRRLPASKCVGYEGA